MTCAITSSSTSPAHFTAPGSLVKKDTTSSASASSGSTVSPFRPWTMSPTSSGNAICSLSISALSSTPPPSTHLPRPAIA